MAEKPILFSTKMVRALLEGRKTQTRRLVKPVGKDEGFVVVETDTGELWPFRSYDGESWDDGNGCEVAIDCPYGVPGDTLWVRETWAAPVNWNDVAPKDIPAWVGCWWLADDNRPLSEEELRWRPSIHMPHWASRITLRVTGVRVERVQEISEEDARDEGITYAQAMEIGDSYRGGFRSLWHTIHAEYGPHGWTANPWVWVVEFEKEAAK